MKQLKNKWEKPNCNLCGGRKMTKIYKDITYWEYPGKFTIVSCDDCSLIFTSPRPVLSEMEKYYESKMYFGRDVNVEDDMQDEEFREDQYGPMYDAILNNKKSGKILDIGAGTGLLLSKFKDKGWVVDGVELTGSAVRYAKRKYGIVLSRGDFLKKKIDKKYDVIVLNGALEHLHEPFETLEKANSNLKKDGFILISIPNSDSIGRKLFGGSWFAWQPPRHLYHFSPKTVKAILEKAGYKNIRVSHNFDKQNYYILFQSARYKMSPKFKKRKTGGLFRQEEAFKASFSAKKELGKIFFKMAFYAISKLEPFLRRGEVIIVYAEK